MIEKRLVQWYASDAGVDLDIAEREITLTYALRVMADHSLSKYWAFKGGTAIRKLYLGNQGRFSLDLDFTAVGEIDPETLILNTVRAFHKQVHFGIAFTISDDDYFANPESYGAEVSYQHEWTDMGRFGIQVSFRSQPLLPIHPSPLLRERYFDWLGVEPPRVPSLNLHEIIGEKIRAAAQRSRVRDLYDLYQLATQRYDRDLVRRITVIKCWETNFPFSPTVFLENVRTGRYDWADLRRLVRHGRKLRPASIIQGVQDGYQFLKDLTPEETSLAADPYQRELQTYSSLKDSLSNNK
jgi:predicted nucleotidyltransferase component of viral defense system